MNTPWTCPRCNRIYGPGVPECASCNLAISKTQPDKDPLAPFREQYPNASLPPNTWRRDWEVPCMFDGLPDGVYHLACPCPRHGSYV